MAVRIRLRKPGKPIRSRYHFQIVVSDSRESREGRFIDMIGYYDPSHKPELLEVDLEKVQKWVKKGIQPTEATKWKPSSTSTSFRATAQPF